ncbi:7-cyano-7-deazaguanine synthase QueC [Succinivibrio dextrinosolvens]|uniref:7-cyano-7-deazaguanine synthase QueC n=1 Tax=Succinivibrio dextrinosolvens TaxID=83771 RepID=UPI0004E178F8|nr:7-cyano-7-deazaguanine synthase QueC [Succinivibrio dextrinosolvens]
MKKALVVFSGGQDSSTCLYYAVKNYDAVYTIGFKYGQRHEIELKCRQEFLDALKSFDKEAKDKLIEDKVVDMIALKTLTNSALTIESGEYVMDERNSLPTSFVPGRNLIFLCYAASYAYSVGADTIISGVGQADYSGYPDCRESTLKALESAINLGMESNIKLLSPLMHLTKGETFKLAYDLGGDEFVRMIVEKTHTCYEGSHDVLHAWGYGCGECPSCLLRKRGYDDYLKLRGKL